MGAQSEDDVLLATALTAAHEAGELITKRFKLPKRFDFKPDSSAVTDADIEAERTIKRIIEERHPSHSFIGEESGRSSPSKPFTWVVDPIDGTKNFLRGIPLFSIEIALLRDGRPYLGVSSLPLLGDTLWAISGRGAYSNKGPLSVSKVRRLEDAYLSFGNLKHFTRRGLLERLSALTSRVFQSRGIGDAWSFHMLSYGNIDVFVDASTACWDIAALAVIVQEAGGTITDLDGEAIGEGSTSVIATNGRLHSSALEYFRN